MRIQKGKNHWELIINDKVVMKTKTKKEITEEGAREALRDWEEKIEKDYEREKVKFVREVNMLRDIF